MKKYCIFCVALVASLISCASPAPRLECPYPVESFKTGSGEVQIAMIHHGTLAVMYNDFLIQIDPLISHAGAELDYSSFPKADVVLITHEHGDHLQKEAIDYVSDENTRLILNKKSSEAIGGAGEVMNNGETVTLSKKVTLTAVPAYNTTPGRENMHPKGNGNGYIIEMDGFKLYVSGDTEDIKELSDFPDDIDLAFLSVNQPYTMTAEQCVNAALVLKPAALVPYHLGNTDMEQIKTKLDSLNSGINIYLYETLR